MAFLLSKSNIASHLRSHLQRSDDSLARSTRQFHVEPGSREKPLLADEQALMRLISHAYKMKRRLEVLMIIAAAGLAGCCYGIYHVIAVTREETRKQEKPGS